MTINDLCERWSGDKRIDALLPAFLNDLPEHGRTKCPKRILACGMYEIAYWLCHHCEPSFTPDQLDTIFCEGVTP